MVWATLKNSKQFIMAELACYTLFGSVSLFFVFFGLLIFALILADLNENGYYATVSFAIFIGLIYFWGEIVVLSIFTVKNVLMYVFVGFLFSLVRTYFKGKELNKKDKSYKETFRLKDNVFRWWFLFPISAINWIFGHLLRDLYNWVYSKVEKIYVAIFNM